MTLLRRECPDVQFMRGCESQDGKRRRDGLGRGALHDHFLARTKYAIDERLIRRLALRAGYGHSIEVADCAPGSKREAYYISKYITKTTDERRKVPWRAEVVDVETGEVRRELVLARFRTWSCSRRWGMTMAQALAEAAVSARSRASTADAGPEPDISELLALLGGELIDCESPPAPS